jgi:predicted kinase
MPELRHQTVVIVAGPPGAGKSTVAPAIAHELAAASIDIDATFSPIVPLLEGHAVTAVRDAIYESLVATIEASLQAGVHVVIAAPFTRERRDPVAWERLSNRLSSYGAEAVLVWLHAPRELLLERLAARGASRDADKLADPASWLREAEPELSPAVPHIAVDATDEPEQAVDRILRELVERDRASAEPRLGRSIEACSSSV